MNVSSTRELSALIGAAYAAGLDPSGVGWPAVLERASPLVAADGPVVLAVQHRPLEYGRTHYVRTDPADAARFQSYYARIDPVLAPVLPHATPGALLLTEALMPVRELRRTEFYADWLRPLGVGAGAGAVLLRHEPAEVHFYAVRPRGRGPFAGASLEALTLLLPHLAAALGTTLRLTAARAEHDASAAAVGHGAAAVILVDRAARVRTANGAGERLLAAADGLAVEPAAPAGRGRLRAGTPAITAALRRLITEAATTATPMTGAGEVRAPRARGHALALPRSSSRSALAAYVVPLPPGAADGVPWLEPLGDDHGRAAAVVHVIDPAATHPESAAVARAHLRAVYGLTAAEAAVAVALAQGGGLAAVAAAHRVALATVRTQAQHGYRKVGVRGQAGLARLVERLGR